MRVIVDEKIKFPYRRETSHSVFQEQLLLQQGREGLPIFIHRIMARMIVSVITTHFNSNAMTVNINYCCPLYYSRGSLDCFDLQSTAGFSTPPKPGLLLHHDKKDDTNQMSGVKKTCNTMWRYIKAILRLRNDVTGCWSSSMKCG